MATRGDGTDPLQVSDWKESDGGKYTLPRRMSIHDARKIRKEIIVNKADPAKFGVTVQPGMTWGQRVIRQAFFPAVVGALGGAAGTIVGGPAGGLIGLVGGSAAGEAINQYFDPFGAQTSDPDIWQVGLAGALGFLPAGVRKGLLSVLPTAAVAPGLQRFAIKGLGEKGAKVVQRVVEGARESSSLLFQKAAGAGRRLKVPLNSTRTASSVMLREVDRSVFAGPASKKLLTRSLDLANSSPDFADVRLNMSDLGATIGRLSKSGGAALGRAKAVYKAMWQDLDTALKTAPAGETGTLLKQAISTYRREEAGRILGSTLKGSFTRGGPGLQQVNVNGVLNKLDNLKDTLTVLLPENEVDEVFRMVRKFRKVPPLEAAAQTGIGGQAFAERAIVSGAIGLVAGGGPQSAAAAVIGLEVFAKMLTSAPGRAAVATMAAGPMTLDAIANALGQSVLKSWTAAPEAGSVNPVRKQGRRIIRERARQFGVEGLLK